MSDKLFSHIVGAVCCWPNSDELCFFALEWWHEECVMKWWQPTNNCCYELKFSVLYAIYLRQGGYVFTLSVYLLAKNLLDRFSQIWWKCAVQGPRKKTHLDFGRNADHVTLRLW